MTHTDDYRWILLAGLVVIVAALSGTSSASAQVLTSVEFSFSNPGARSLGLGGAFVALADDATAAFANPAGLIQLVEPEVSVEARTWTYESFYTAGGRISGPPTGIGIDTVAGVVPGESNVSLGGVSFLSFVYPWKNWSFAAYQHQLINFELRQEIQGLFATGPGPGGSLRGPIESAVFDFEIVARSVAAGYRVSDTLSLGLGFSYFDPDYLISGDEYLPLSEAETFAPIGFQPDRLLHSFVAESEGGDWGLAGGFLWSVSPRWRIGGAYRQGADQRVRIRGVAGPAHPDLPAGTVFAEGSSPWSTPDVWALGASYRSTDGHWTAGFEWDRVEYSTVIDSLAPELRGPESGIDDADELRAGGEYAFFAGPSVVGVRLGAWLDPDHRVHDESGSEFAQAEHLPGEDEIHFAAGVGVAYKSLQFDLGVDLSDRRDTASLSAIYSF